MRRRPAALAALAALACALGALGASAAAHDASREPPQRRSTAPRLAVHTGAAWRTWWRGDSAPARWDDRAPVLARHARWRAAGAGVEWTELALAGAGEAWRTRLVAARVDPARVRLALDTAWDASGDAAWRVDRAPPEARLAVNAGQFVATLPWGWVVLDGNELLPPGRGPLVTTVAVDHGGRVHWRHGGALPDESHEGSGGRAPRWAFQSYPTLLAGGVVPAALRGEAVPAPDLAHRDARVAIGRLADGRLVVALTRWDVAGSALGAVPFGLTVPEVAAVMGALGARDAVLLDGGISGQLRLRDAAGQVHAWRGVRAVPLALVVRDR